MHVYLSPVRMCTWLGFDEGSLKTPDSVVLEEDLQQTFMEYLPRTSSASRRIEEWFAL